MDVLGATDFFSSEIWARFAFVLAWVLSFSLPDHCLRHVASMKSSLHQWWMLVVPLWSLNMRTQRGSLRGVVNEGMRAQRDPCGKRILRQTSLASVSYNHQGALHQGMGRVVLPVVRPHAIRDGPIPHRQWPGELFPYVNCKAA